MFAGKESRENGGRPEQQFLWLYFSVTLRGGNIMENRIPLSKHIKPIYMMPVSNNVSIAQGYVPSDCCHLWNQIKENS